MQHGNATQLSKIVGIAWQAKGFGRPDAHGPAGAEDLQPIRIPIDANLRLGNPNLAGFLRETGFAQRFGAGIATARRECSRNGNHLPEFKISNLAFAVTLQPAEEVIEEP